METVHIQIRRNLLIPSLTVGVQLQQDHTVGVQLQQDHTVGVQLQQDHSCYNS